MHAINFAKQSTFLLQLGSLGTDQDDVVGLGLRISRPLSSQDMLKSDSTCRTRETTIAGATTRL